jgi:hypothetical protein
VKEHVVRPKIAVHDVVGMQSYHSDGCAMNDLPLPLVVPLLTNETMTGFRKERLE